MSERELVIMIVTPCEGNEAGEVLIYRDELPEGAVVKEAGAVAAVEDVSRMSKAQLMALLDEQGIERDGTETKAELVARVNILNRV